MKYLFITLILFSTAIVYGQTSKAPNEKSAAIQIIKQIGSNLNQDLLFKLPDNDAFLISAGLLIDKDGKVSESFYSSNTIQNYNKILNFNTLLGKLKSVSFKSSGYTDCILILPVLFKHSDAAKIENGKEFLQSYSHLWPNIPSKFRDKKMNLLPPEINLFFKPIR